MSTINGTAGDDFLGGDQDEDETPNEDPQTDIISGLAGNDSLFGYKLADQLYGGTENDTLYGGTGADVLDGGDGEDTAIYLDNTVDYIIDLTLGTGTRGDADGDTLVSIENVQGAGGKDTIIGNEVENHLYGMDGNDVMHGGGGFDELYGGFGNDTLYGGALNDFLQGGDGDDTLYGGDNDGADSFDPGAGADKMYAGSSLVDSVDYRNLATDGVLVNLQTGRGQGGNAASDHYEGIEIVYGTSQFENTLIGDGANNELYGGESDDTLKGGAGDDILQGRGGADHFIGGDGLDTIIYQFPGAPITVDMAANHGSGGEAEGDTYDGIEKILGSITLDDHIIGNNLNNLFYSFNGNDTLSGGGGDDYLEAGNGDDTLNGDSGDDWLISESGADHINGGLNDYDTLDYGHYMVGGPVSVDMLAGTAVDQYGNTDTIFEIEHVIGTLHDDTFQAAQNVITARRFDGNEGNDIFRAATVDPPVGNIRTLMALFYGGDGIDQFFLGDGGTTVYGGKGRDTLDASTYVFRHAQNSELDQGLLIDAKSGVMGFNPNANNYDFDPGDTAFGEVGGIEIYEGTGRADAIRGGDLKDTIYGGGGRDILDGGDGNDTLDGGEFKGDTFLDSLGDDTYRDPDGGQLSFENSAHGIVFDLAARTADGNGHDRWDNKINTFSGSNKADTFTTAEGKDEMYGGGGGDIFVVGADETFEDFIRGDDAFDTVNFSARTSPVYIDESATRQDPDSEVFTGTSMHAHTSDHTHFDTMYEIEHYVGSAFDDEFVQSEWDVLHKKDPGRYPTDDPVFLQLDTTFEGSAGNDTFVGIFGNDVFDGGGGSDWMVANSSDDVTIDLAAGLATRRAFHVTLVGVENAQGNDGNDTLVGSVAANELDGGDGNDTLSGGKGNDHIEGGKGIDTVTFENADGNISVDLNANASVGEGNDVIGGVENATGGRFDDALAGDNGKNVLNGGDGDDTLIGRAGNDKLIGGKGIDTVDFSSFGTGMVVNLDDGTAQGDGTDTLSGVENAIGTASHDVLTGSVSQNELYGEDGNDTLDGLSGLDFLHGGDGNDTFIISKRDAFDIVGDFKSADDTLDVAASALPGSIATGNISSNQFVANANPHATVAHSFLYDTDTGVLSYDSDGSGAGAPVQVCVFQGAPTLTFHDIVII